MKFTEFNSNLSASSAKGQHTRNPGYIPGDHWVVCDFCGCDIRSSKARMNWQGYVVCPSDWEPRHPQDFVRVRADNEAARGLVRSGSTTSGAGELSSPVEESDTNTSAVVGIAIVGLAIIGTS